MRRSTVLLVGVGLLVAGARIPTEALTTTNTPACPADALALAGPRADRPVYRVAIDVQILQRRVVGLVTVRFTPDLSIDRLVFRLWANRPAVGAPANRETVGAVTVNGNPTASSLGDPTTLVVALSAPLAAGQSVDAAVPFELALVGWKGDRVSLTGSGLNSAVRLGSFFPILPWEPRRGWILDAPIRDRTETSTTPTASFVTTVTVPQGLTVFATGQGVTDTKNTVPAPGVALDDPTKATFSFAARSVRDLAVSVGRFRVAEGQAMAPDPVRVVVGVQTSLADDPAAYVRRVVSALEAHAHRFGPYPWPEYSLALTPDLKGGIEYPMHVMQGPNSIGRSTPHEVGHMWFYSLVGNDQATDPWLDEGLATWAEVRSEGTLGAFLQKVVPPDGKGRLGEPMSYWDDHKAAYYRSVYVQGTQALAALGTPQEVDCALRAYVAANAFGIAHPSDLLNALTEQFPNIAGPVLARFGVRAPDLGRRRLARLL